MQVRGLAAGTKRHELIDVQTGFCLKADRVSWPKGGRAQLPRQVVQEAGGLRRALQRKSRKLAVAIKTEEEEASRLRNKLQQVVETLNDKSRLVRGLQHRLIS